jgi:hypothetical protein
LKKGGEGGLEKKNNDRRDMELRIIYKISPNPSLPKRVVRETEAAIKKDGEKKNVPKVLRFAIIEGELSIVSPRVYAKEANSIPESARI